MSTNQNLSHGLTLVTGGTGKTGRRVADRLVKMGQQVQILRSSWFCQNFSEGFFLDPILAGEFALPVGEVAEPFVSDYVQQMAATGIWRGNHA